MDTGKPQPFPAEIPFLNDLGVEFLVPLRGDKERIDAIRHKYATVRGRVIIRAQFAC